MLNIEACGKEWETFKLSIHTTTYNTAGQTQCHGGLGPPGFYHCAGPGKEDTRKGLARSGVQV